MKINAGDSILRCEEIFDCEDNLFIVIDEMNGSLTDVIMDMNGQYSENCIKYMCYKTLSGLKFLHERNIIHRDIKSDNVLYNVHGDVQLAVFGVAV